jgi:hypothetical protein
MPGDGLVAAAEQDSKEGKDERPQDVVQAHVSHRAVGAGTAGALRPVGGKFIHPGSLSRDHRPVQRKLTLFGNFSNFSGGSRPGVGNPRHLAFDQ